LDTALDFWFLSGRKGTMLILPQKLQLTTKRSFKVQTPLTLSCPTVCVDGEYEFRWFDCGAAN